MRRAIDGLALAATVLYTGAFVRYELQYGPDQANSLAFVESIARHVPEGAPIYQVDASGYTGFLGGRTIVNGDGLVNSAEYARRVLEERLRGYIEESGICYVITNREAVPGRRLIDYRGLEVEPDDAVLLTRVPAGGTNPWVRFALYRLKRPGC
jgi:hypothetical protein